MTTQNDTYLCDGFDSCLLTRDGNLHRSMKMGSYTQDDVVTCSTTFKETQIVGKGFECINNGITKMSTINQTN